ncbi:MAG: protein-disulfide reductase DsbD [Deltaproteobacteria bacterium]|nr:protein-disulfide reductase DsbD [Deltaproteobacteria bacterium]
MPRLALLLLWWPLLLLIPGSAASQTFLAPEKIFQPQVQALDDRRLGITIRIEDGYYLYKDKISFKIFPPSVKPGAFQLPAGQPKEDPVFGRSEIYRRAFRLTLPILRADPAVQTIELALSFQGCSDRGLCYPPPVRKITVALPPPSREAGPPPGRTLSPAENGPPTPVDESSRITGLLAQKNLLWILLSFFGFGLLLSLTPCVFPMIPILSGLIVSQGAGVTKKQGFLLSLVYVLGMAITYAVAGVLAGLSGSLLAAFFQNPWALSAFALVFVLLALSMFGFYELQLPSRLQNRLCHTSNRLPGGNLFGVLIMGALSALIIGPCVTAPLAGALLYISRTQNVWLGGSALFVLALGMGVPLLILGTSAGALLPKAGPWMEAVKKFFGILLLAVALWLVSPFMALALQMFFLSALLIISSMFLRPLDPLPEGAGAWARIGKGVGLLIFLGGVAYLAGALGGSQNLYQPLAGLGAKGSAGDQPATAGPSFQPLTRTAELDQVLQSSPDRPVLLYFGAEWCTSCKEMEHSTFRDPRVLEKLNKFRLFKVDLTEPHRETQALLKKFSLFGPPTVLLFDRQGREIEKARMVGEHDARQFLSRLELAGN